MEGVYLAKTILLRLLQDVMDWSRSETYQAAVGKWENQLTYFSEKEERHNETYHDDDRCSKTRKKIRVLFPEFSAEETWESITRFRQAPSYD